MTAQAPVCHIPPDVPTDQPSPKNLPAIPPAQATLQSLQASVNAMRQVVLIITGQQGSQGRPGAPGQNGQNANAKGTWSEITRTTSKVKVYQNNDPSTGNYVEVEQINSLTMGNQDTGQTWRWSR